MDLIIRELAESSKRTSQMTCFECHDTTARRIHKCGKEAFFGIMIVDGQAVEFYYSPFSNDGDIYSNDVKLVKLVKYLIPQYVFTKYVEL